MEAQIAVIAGTLFIEFVLWGVGRFRGALNRPSRRFRLNLN